MSEYAFVGVRIAAMLLRYCCDVVAVLCMHDDAVSRCLAHRSLTHSLSLSGVFVLSVCARVVTHVRSLRFPELARTKSSHDVLREFARNRSSALLLSVVFTLIHTLTHSHLILLCVHV